MPYLTRDQLFAVGFRHIGEGVLLSDKASIYNPGAISIGDHTRIDDFCLFSAGEGGIELGSYIHVGCYSSLIGKGRITLEDFSCISSRVSVHSSSDDYSGASMANAVIPDAFKQVHVAPITLRRHVLVGSGAVILPGVELGEGAVLGALSLAKSNLEPFTINAGCPATFRGYRRRDLLEREQEFLATLQHAR